MNQDDLLNTAGSSIATNEGRLILSKRQQAVLGALRTVDSRASLLYLGALHVLGQQENVCRFVLAGHVLRELIDKLPVFTGSTQPKKLPDVYGEIYNLKVYWDRYEKKLTESSQGPIDKSRSKLLKKVGKLISEYGPGASRPNRNKYLNRSLDQAALPLPEALEDLNAQVWSEFYKKFADLAHSGDNLSVPEDFESWLFRFENHLLESLVPRTFDEQAELDSLIKKVES